MKPYLTFIRINWQSVFLQHKSMKKIWIRIPMKSGIIFICVIAAAITINSCKKTKYYACCDTGHAHWEGDKTEKEIDAKMAANDHDLIIHGCTSYTCSVAGVCSTP